MYNSSKKKRDNKVKLELLKYITENVNQLSISQRKEVMNIVINDLGSNDIEECADGCRMIINHLSIESINSIIEIISKVL
jgi:hypothetical protein